MKPITAKQATRFENKMTKLHGLYKTYEQAREQKDFEAENAASRAVNAHLATFSELDNELWGVAMISEVVTTPIADIEDYEDEKYSPAENRLMQKMYRLYRRITPTAVEIREQFHCTLLTAKRAAKLYPEFRGDAETLAAAQEMQKLTGNTAA
jgi:hypothetical protein